jgi:hypothetical protein
MIQSIHHWKIPTRALRNNLPWIVYPVLIVVATVPAGHPGIAGICNKLYWVLGSNYLPVGSNSYISNDFNISTSFFWVSTIPIINGSFESGYYLTA